ncbi:murein tripeptide/oligopeptide ABC transporter ATP binding protein OppF [Psittacicella gerlachiana]|uniref:Oligopeptide ABC transporter ATP-binding protein OppF n=1 Tax=Psittacicella gerlachiana TaxID=2028574 RepID=A0A3A1YAE9_9GAMM|nr:murein tripeptide/oligopeptide ABC transporter ATP binding protein OppF [Psittacicella gerlachiana]RIY35122.1 oligopeptide ABC transporter ATP-binding protein OppF [Psittacicella gerlachiana]
MSNELKKDQVLLSVRNLDVNFKIKRSGGLFFNKYNTLKAVKNVNFDLKVGETLGVVGESGCGKSTLSRAIVGLVEGKGSVKFLGEELIGISQRKRRKYKKDIQMIFQDPSASLNPRITVGELIAEPLKIHFPHMTKSQIREEVLATMQKVGLLPNMINRYPHEFSGGQAQRIGIARALITRPKIIICDEPVSALDVSIQAQVVNLLKDLQKEYGISLIFIAHDLSVVRHISDRVLVMYLGSVFELSTSTEIFDNTKHPYTRALMSAVPIPDPDLERNKKIEFLDGDLPSPINPPSGCVFRTRCKYATEQCATTPPKLEDEGRNGVPHFVACYNLINVKNI